MEFSDFLHIFAFDAEITNLVVSGKKLTEIAKQVGTSNVTVRKRYNRFSRQLFWYYINCINKLTIPCNQIDNANEILYFYARYIYAVAFLEYKHRDTLELCRGGHPPIANLPFPPYLKMTNEQEHSLTLQIIDSHDKGKKTFVAIGKELSLTRDKTQQLYSRYYHKRVLAAIDIIEPTVQFDFFNYIIRSSFNSKLRWEKIVNEYSDVLTNSAIEIS